MEPAYSATGTLTIQTPLMQMDVRYIGTYIRDIVCEFYKFKSRSNLQIGYSHFLNGPRMPGVHLIGYPLPIFIRPYCLSRFGPKHSRV